MSGAARGDALYAGVTKQLEILGEDHVGYRGKAFRAASGTAFSVVGARPFSKVQPPILSLSRILSSLESLAFDPAPLLLSAMRVFFFWILHTPESCAASTQLGCAVSDQIWLLIKAFHVMILGISFRRWLSIWQ